MKNELIVSNLLASKYFYGKIFHKFSILVKGSFLKMIVSE